jgi:uncharacterized protein
VIRAVIDTNVFVSALISASGNEAFVVLAIEHGLIKPCFSPEIMTEYAEVLARVKFGFPADEIKSLLELLRRRGEQLVDSQSLSPTSPDPTDDKFLACARAANVDYIVTGNKRHFPSRACKPIQVVNATQLLDHITFQI